LRSMKIGLKRRPIGIGWIEDDQPVSPHPRRVRKLDRIAKAARRLLASLGVNDPDEAADGPRDPEILNALVLVGEPNADAVIEATRRIGRLMEILDSIAAAAEFDRRAKKAATEVAEVGKLTVRQGNPGDDAVNDWIADMMSIYRMITGKERGLATSVTCTWTMRSFKCAKYEFRSRATHR
jgi:hypothetical protein